MTFDSFVPYLANPLVLAGFGLLLVFSVHRALVGSGIIRPLPGKASTGVVRLILHYGFAIAALVVALGFALAFYRAYSTSRPTALTRIAAETIVQQNRGNIERCLANIDLRPEFLDIIITQTQGGIGADLVMGEVSDLSQVYHPKTCADEEAFNFGLASWQKIFAIFDEKEVIRQNPSDLTRCYRIYDDEHYDPTPYQVTFGERLSINYPDVNGCILNALRPELITFDKVTPFVHRYVTDWGVWYLSAIAK
jgi:hypothetical protein